MPPPQGPPKSPQFCGACLSRGCRLDKIFVNDEEKNVIFECHLKTMPMKFFQVNFVEILLFGYLYNHNVTKNHPANPLLLVRFSIRQNDSICLKKIKAKEEYASADFPSMFLFKNSSMTYRKVKYFCYMLFVQT